MRHPQIVVYEDTGELAALLEPLAKENGWLLRESRQPAACLNLLKQVRPSVLVLKLRDLLAEFDLISRLNEQAPEVGIILVSDVKLESSDQRLNLSGLAYDLGASYVMFPPMEGPILEDLVAGLMIIARTRMNESGDVDA
jgi:DNA-binding response OmpR family regulator